MAILQKKAAVHVEYFWTETVYEWLPAHDYSESENVDTIIGAAANELHCCSRV